VIGKFKWGGIGSGIEYRRPIRKSDLGKDILTKDISTKGLSKLTAKQTFNQHEMAAW